eukprot:1141517-Pelagomonas_calceolata.AAC.6
MQAGVLLRPDRTHQQVALVSMAEACISLPTVRGAASPLPGRSIFEPWLSRSQAHQLIEAFMSSPTGRGNCEPTD